MKKSIIVLLLLVAPSLSVLFAQEVITTSVKLDVMEMNEIVMPPELYVDIDFEDYNGNKILEANEKGMIKLVITNKGGDANLINVSISPQKL